MFKKIVSKDSLRHVTGKKRLPKHMILYLTGAVLYDILKENGEDDTYELMNTTYSLVMKSAGRKEAILTGGFNIQKKAVFDMKKMATLIRNSKRLSGLLQSMSNFPRDEAYEILFNRFVRGNPSLERKYNRA